MRYVIKIVSALTFTISNYTVHAESLREATLRERAIDTGLAAPELVNKPVSEKLVNVGRVLFESKVLSLDYETSCRTCHLDRFGSTDGLPNAVGTKGQGEGTERLRGGGDIIPRNTLPLWGRGSVGFDVFFWDGKVDASQTPMISQFGDAPPSSDGLTVAVHLPIVEVREMVSDVDSVDSYMTETVESAEAIYDILERRVRGDPILSSMLSRGIGIQKSEIKIIHVATAIAEFIKDRFRIQMTRFHKFVFDEGALSASEIAGGLLFYGKARCFTCHNGHFFSDLSFHAIPLAQIGFGKNGFGIDYGRFNVTLNPSDMYKFRTPPLFNVTKTAPYSHSGNTYDLADAIRAHVDPLSVIEISEMSGPQRAAFYERLKAWSDEPISGVYLTVAELKSLIDFLHTLNFSNKELN